ncbi:MAG: ATP-binding protein [Thermodesulfobacteriota bacterium]|nr:ATP-binding protein [Thermodesulfobacteriota bacterium]
MKTAREIISIIGSFVLGSLCLVFLSYFQKNLIGISHVYSGYVVPILAGGTIGSTFYMLLLYIAELSQLNKQLTHATDHHIEKTTSTNSQLIFYVLFGIATLCLFSTMQKSIAGYPLHLKGFVVPLLFGGLSGLLIGLLFLRNRRLLDQERRAVIFWQQEKDKTFDILNSISDGLLVTGSNGLVELVNERAEKFLDIPAATIKGQTLATLISHATDDDFSAFFSPANIGSTIQFNIITRDGSLRAIKGTTSAVHSRKTRTGAVILTLRDNTAEQRIERMKSEFISMATHNLKTPITAITGYSELLLSDHHVEAEQLHEFLTYINDKAWQLDKLINNMLVLNRVDSDRTINLTKEVVPTSAMLDAARKYYNEQKTPCKLHFDLHDTTCSLFIDPAKIEQVLENLIDNSIKFSPDGGQICISSVQQKNRYEITISDEGIGMSEEECQHIFDRFYRADATDSAKNGVGLGLTLTKKIIEAHSGEIHAVSSPRQGTTITLSLPIRESDLHDK